jgi:hypothetical protein
MRGKSPSAHLAPPRPRAAAPAPRRRDRRLGVRDATFEIVTHDAPHTLVHRSTRGRLEVSWAIHLTADGDGATRVHLRFRLAGARRVRLAEHGGGLLDLLTVAGLAAGLRERVSRQA